MNAADSPARLLSENLGQSVAVDHDGASALAIADEFRSDVVPLDVGMPGLDGLEFARRLQARSEFDRTLPAAHAGRRQESEQPLSEASGFDVLLFKPAAPTG